MFITRHKLHGSRWFGAVALSIFPAFAGTALPDSAQQIQMQTQPAGNPPPAVALTAVEAAAQEGNRDALRMILRNGSPSEQSSAFDALHAMDPQLATEAAVSDFRDRRPGSRLQSLVLIAESPVIADSTVIAVLHEALHDEDTSVSDYAVQALARRTDAGQRLLTASELSSPQSIPQQLAKVRIATLERDHSTLVELLRKGEAAAQTAAFETLAADDPASAFATLVSELQDKVSGNRLQSLELLLRTPSTDRQLLERVLGEAAQDQDLVVSAYAKLALDEKHQEDSLPATALNRAR